MHQITLEEAARRLPELAREAGAGEEIILLQDNQPIARLVALAPLLPRARRGSAKGEIVYIAPDFDSIPEGFEEYLP